MDSHLRYRGYVIFHDGTEFVAEPQEAVSPICEIGGQSLDLIIAMIDELWLSMSRKASLPDWFQQWLDAGEHGRIRAKRPKVPSRTLVRTQEIIVTNISIDTSINININGAGGFIHLQLNNDDIRLPVPESSYVEDVAVYLTSIMRLHPDVKISNICYG